MAAPLAPGAAWISWLRRSFKFALNFGRGIYRAVIDRCYKSSQIAFPSTPHGRSDQPAEPLPLVQQDHMAAAGLSPHPSPGPAAAIMPSGKWRQDLTRAESTANCINNVRCI